MLPSLDQSPTDLQPATLLNRLRARGLRPRLATSECCGERDLRIRVRRGPLGPAVELLCCTADDPEPPQWHAVRLVGRQRTVWRGPAADGAPDAVLDFVEDLLVLDEAALADRYLPLG